MATSRQKQTEVEPLVPQLTPSAPVMGSADLTGFIWQQLSEIQRNIGSIQESQKNLTASIEKMDLKTSSKLSIIEGELTEIKQIRHTAKVVSWIVGVGFAGLFTVGSIVASTMWDALKPMTAQFMQQAAIKAGQQQTPSTLPPVK